MTDRKSKTPAERALEALGPKLRQFAKAAKNVETATTAQNAAVAAAHEAASRLSYAVSNPDLPSREDNDDVAAAKVLLEDWYGVQEGEDAEPEDPEADAIRVGPERPLG